MTYTSYSPYFDGSDMTADETEFLLAVASYQKRFRRRYPTWLEVLHIAHCLGYRKVADPVPVAEPVPPVPANPGREEVPSARREGFGADPRRD
jgi:hypothetical protein